MSTYDEFCKKLDKLDNEFKAKMEDQNKKFFADRPSDDTISPELRDHYQEFEKMIREHTERFIDQMQSQMEKFKKRYSDTINENK